MSNAIAIHESQDSDKVVKFIELEHFTTAFQELYNNNLIWGVFYKDGHIVATDTDGDIIPDII